MVLFVILALSVAGYYFSRKDKVVQLEVPNEILDWKTYNNSLYNFSIKYPNKLKTCIADGGEIFCQEDWVYEESQFDSGVASVAFGTKSSKIGGWSWGVSVFSKQSHSKENLISLLWSHAPDRKEKRENILINGRTALLVTVSSSQSINLALKDVFIETNDRIYRISGSTSIPEFEAFYKSFRLK